MADDDAERTEEPTPKRIEDARRKGEVAASKDVSTAVVLAVALVGFGAFAIDGLGASLAAQSRSLWSGSEIHPTTLDDFHSLLLHHGAATGRAMLPFLLLLMGAGALASVAQTGPLFSTEALAWKGQRLDPIKGLKRLVNLDRLVDLAKAPLKVGVVAVALWLAFTVSLDEMLSLVAAPPAAALVSAERLGFGVARTAVVGLALLAVLDLAWVRHRYQKRLRMTTKEVRDELKDREGSPQIRSRRRQLQRELSRQRMIAEVAKADVVIANPTHFSVALRYARGEMSAPRVLARGRGELALRIRKVARQHDVPIVENAPLARVLYRVGKVGREIPEHLFQAVAEVLAYVYRVDRRRGAAWTEAS